MRPQFYYQTKKTLCPVSGHVRHEDVPYTLFHVNPLNTYHIDIADMILVRHNAHKNPVTVTKAKPWNIKALSSDTDIDKRPQSSVPLPHAKHRKKSPNLSYMISLNVFHIEMPDMNLARHNAHENLETKAKAWKIIDLIWYEASVPLSNTGNILSSHVRHTPNINIDACASSYNLQLMWHWGNWHEFGQTKYTWKSCDQSKNMKNQSSRLIWGLCSTTTNFSAILLMCLYCILCKCISNINIR